MLNMLYRFFFSLWALLGTLGTAPVLAQQAPFDLSIEEISFPGLPQLQSFAFAQWAGKVLLIGGRRDGLHQRRPFEAFAPAANNASLYLIDIEKQTVVERSLAGFPSALQEQLRASNVQFVQVQERLYLIGGYAYSETADDHITFPMLTSVNVPGLVAAMQRPGAALSPYFSYTTDERMAVCGGQLGYLDGRFLLAGGHRFDGPYNPNDMPTFVQTYTDEVRVFGIADSDQGPRLTDYATMHDATYWHRRDYNLVPQVLGDGRLAYTAFSGVFQHHTDVPFTNVVDVWGKGYAPSDDFTQYLSHYHSAHAALYDAASRTMHTLFFGGISQFFIDEDGDLAEDPDVPFVRTISHVMRDSAGRLSEHRWPIEMPGYLGAAAAFLPNPLLAKHPHQVIKAEALPAGVPVRLGYLYGGIESTQANVFWENGDSLSAATSRLLAVTITPKAAQAPQLQAMPTGNPLRISAQARANTLHVSVSLPAAGDAFFWLQDAAGRMVQDWVSEPDAAGTYELELPLDKEIIGGAYRVVVNFGRWHRSVALAAKP